MKLLKTLFCFSFLTASVVFATPVDDLFSVLEKQQSQLPIQLSKGLMLTEIDVEPKDKKVVRHYVFDSVDFGKLTTKVAKRYSRGFLGEILQQCSSHQELIYDENVNFEYSVRDMKGRLVLLEQINKSRCIAFSHYH